MASDDALQLAAPESNTGKPIVWIAILLALTLVAAGAGSALGLRVIAMIKASSEANKPIDRPKAETPKYSSETNLRTLPPIVGNFANPSNIWCRIEAAIVFDNGTVPKPDILAAQIAEDILGYLKTLSLSDVGGPSGLQHLREDLNERVAIRSEGKVRELIILSLAIQ
jgi:flagellar FliL protein